MTETHAGSRQIMKGKVVSVAMEKTAVVEVTILRAHPVYKKRYRTTRRYYVHDENNECSVGDLIRMEETRPRSKKKRWRLLNIVEKAR